MSVHDKKIKLKKENQNQASCVKHGRSATLYTRLNDIHLLPESKIYSRGEGRVCTAFDSL